MGGGGGGSTGGTSKPGTVLAEGTASQANIFGIITDLQVLTASVVFIGFIGFLMFMEFTISRMEHWCDKRGLKALMEKMQKELMMMGIIGFVVFMFESFSSDPSILDHGGAKFLSFEMAHLIVLFMAFAFVFQACYLVWFSQIYGNIYTNAMRTGIVRFIEMYKELHTASWAYWRFHNHSSYFPFTPALRNDIEFRIIGR